MKLRKKEDHSVDTSVLLRRENKNPREEIQRQSVEQRLNERPARDCPTYIQLPNPGTIVDARKCLLTGARYSCHPRDTARA